MCINIWNISMLHFGHIMLLIACLLYHFHNKNVFLAFLIQFCVKKMSLTLWWGKQKTQENNITSFGWCFQCDDDCFWFIHHTGHVRSNSMHCIVGHMHILAKAGHMGMSCICNICISSMVYNAKTVLCYSEQSQIPPRAAKSLFLKVRTIL